MPSETHRHLRVHNVKGVAVVSFSAPDAIFLEKTVQELDDELLRLVKEEGRIQLAINLSGIRYLSSSMLVRLINLHKKVESENGQLVLCCLEPVMRDTFRVSKLDHLLEIYADVPAALAHFGVHGES